MSDSELFILGLLLVIHIIVLLINETSSAKTIKRLAILAVGVTISAMIWVALFPENLFTILLIPTLGVWAINTSKYFAQRHNMQYLKRSLLKDSFIFFSISVVLLSLAALVDYFDNSLDATQQMQSIIAVASVTVSGLLFASAIASINRYRFHIRDAYELNDPPSVTLAIPARNETHAMKSCIESALSSNYEKLEIIVLDDCSQDATAEIIKSYAHKGVRFVQGKEPSSSWIGKNRAYSTLLEEASGDLVLFTGVDVHLGPESITNLVKFFQSNQLQMVSVLPQRLNLDLKAHIIQPMRYFWQLAIPRFLTSQPAVISSAWMIDRQTAKKLGGFEAVKNSIIPEAYFARRIDRQAGYSYVISQPELGFTTRKRPKSQLSTALRTLYPLTGRSFSLTWLAALLILIVFVAPYYSLFLWFTTDSRPEYWLSPILLTAAHVVILTRVAPIAWFTGLVTFPIAMLSESWLLIQSAWSYEFGSIEWKGRNICIPAMRPLKSTKK